MKDQVIKYISKFIDKTKLNSKKSIFIFNYILL